MNYTITENSRAHVNGHFGNSTSAGSLFRFDVFPDVDSLIIFLSPQQPSQIIKQSNKLQAHEYIIKQLPYVGWLGIGKINEYKNTPIQIEIRNGRPVPFIPVKLLPNTNKITIIAEELADSSFQIITAFPGPYAPAFPNDKMSKSDFNTSTTFWEKHILLKKEI